MTALYNDIEEYPCKILKLRIDDGWLPAGKVTNEDIRTLCKKDLSKYSQVHMFAGIGGFPLAARLAGVPDDFKIFTGGFPCQPFSAAGQRRGTEDHRYLWPATYTAFKSHRPDVAIFENVAGLASMGFPGEKTLMDIKTLAGRIRHYLYRRKELAVLIQISNQIEEAGYSVQSFIIPACAVDAKHRRDRIWIVAIRNDLANSSGQQNHAKRGTRQRGRDALGREEKATQQKNRQASSNGFNGCREALANTQSKGGERLPVRKTMSHTVIRGPGQNVANAADGVNSTRGTQVNQWGFQNGILRARGGACNWQAEPSICRVVDGIPARVDRIRGLGNAIVPQVAAEIMSYLLAALGIEPEWRI